jgi:hypothetical protein
MDPGQRAALGLGPRYAGDLRAAITTIENRLADAGVGSAIGAGEGPRA